MDTALRTSRHYGKRTKDEHGYEGVGSKGVNSWTTFPSVTVNEFLVPIFSTVRFPESSLSNGQLSDSVPGAGFRARIQNVHQSLSVNGDETRSVKSRLQCFIEVVQTGCRHVPYPPTNRITAVVTAASKLS